MTKNDPDVKPLPCVRRRSTSLLWHYWKPRANQNTTRPANVPPAMVETIAQRVRSAVLLEDGRAQIQWR